MRYQKFINILTEEFLYKEYVINKKTAKQIAKEVGAGQDTVARYLHNFGFRIDHGRFNKGKPAWNKGLTKELDERVKKQGVKERIWSDEHKLNISNKLTEYWKNEENRKAQSIRLIGKTSHVAWNIGKTKETDERVLNNSESIKISSNKEVVRLKKSTAMKSVWTREEYRSKQSGKNSCRYGKVPPEKSAYGKGNYYYCKDGRRLWLRSTLELRVAKILDSCNIFWEYETVAFEIDGYRTYHPDFILYDNYDIVVWEVKGFWRYDNERERMEQFLIQYPEVNLKIIWLSYIKILEYNISNNISFNVLEIFNCDLEDPERKKLL